MYISSLKNNLVPGLGVLTVLLVTAALGACNDAHGPGSTLTAAEPGSNLTTTKTATETSDASLKPAFVSVDFGAPQGALVRTERFNTWDNGDPAPELRAEDVTFLNEQGLHSEIVRIGFSVDEHCDVAANACDFSSIADWIGDISDATDSLVVHLTPKHIIEQHRPPADAKHLLKLAIRELKKRFPKIDYIEATNEPDWEFHGAQIYAHKEPVLQPEQVYPYYVPFYQAVNEVNKELSPSAQIKIGGPALTGMTKTWMTAFLDGYAADQNPDKRLDFISFHGYGEFSDDFKEYRAYKSD
jgi:hypothetical protein